MEFGDRTRFAVSLEINENSGGAWMFGKFCYWIGGKMVGNYEEGTSLRDVLFALKWIVYDSGKREDCVKFEVPPDDLFVAIRSMFTTEIVDDDPPARFEVRPLIDIFFRWEIYLIDCRNQARLLYREHSDLNVSELFLRKAEFDECIQLAWDELNVLYDRAVGTRGP